MDTKITPSAAAAALGALGGASRSRKKIAAAKRNGAKGGWPRGRKRGQKKIATAQQPCIHAGSSVMTTLS